MINGYQYFNFNFFPVRDNILNDILIMSWEDFIISVTWKKKLKFNSGKENSKIDDVI